MPASRWSDLPPDLAREISGRLLQATDFVHFHAVCKPWRGSWSPTAAGTATAMTTRAHFMPWLLAASTDDSARLEMRCVFSRSNYRSQLLLSKPRGVWLTSSGGTAVRCLTIECLCPILHDLLTGATAHLPLLPDDLCREWEKKGICLGGFIYDDGTTLLYNLCSVSATGRITAALLGPGDPGWTLVTRTLERPHWSRQLHQFCVAYHRGMILLEVKAGLWRITTPNGDDVLVPRAATSVVQLQNHFESLYEYNYVFESRGELLWASIQAREYDDSYHWRRWDYPRELKVFVHALEVEEPTSQLPEKKMRWVTKNGRTLADRVLFLGLRNSFAMDAAQLGLGSNHGGCVYFIYHGIRPAQHDLFRYNLVDGKAKLVEQLPQCWDHNMCTWFNPESIITPIQEINGKSLEDTKLTKQQLQQTNIERHRAPSFRVLVRNLPLTLKTAQLRLFFSEHGKVFSADVIRYKKTGVSQGIGHVTIETTHAHLDDALAYLNKLVLEGHNLEVSLVKEGLPRRRRRQRRYI